MKHVLLIDDNEIANYLSEHIITNSKITEKVSVYVSAIEALEYLRTLQNNQEEFPEVIFLDIKMPEMDGFGFLDEFSKFPEITDKDISVFMLTSSDDPKDKNRVAQYPIVKNFFTKPLNKNMLNELK